MNKIIDIPSPIDLKDPLHATQWAKEANLKRPYRIEFFEYYISQILNGDFDHKLSKLIEIIMVMDKVPILNLENIDDCINIDKEIGIDKLNERFTFNITINYNNVFELEKETSKRNFEFLEQQNLFNFGNLKKANLKPVEYTLLN